MSEQRLPSPCAMVRDLVNAAVARVRVARWIGEQAVAYGRRELVSAFNAPLASRAGDAAGDADRADVDDVDDVGADVAADAQFEDTAVPGAPAPAEPELEVRVGDAAPAGDAVPVPFEGYDTLPAAHIVQRLARMPADELVAVRAYELGRRNRRTVLAKIDQLLGG